MSSLVETYPASTLQQGMLFQRLYERHPGVDLLQVGCDMREGLEVAHFEQAWTAAMERHDALRTSIDWGGADAGTQHVHRGVAMPFTVQDWRRLSASEIETQWQRFLHEDRVAGFALGTPPLMRLMLVRTGSRRWRFCWTLHHILLDSRSVHLVLDEVFARLDGNEPRFGRTSGAAPQFREFIAWHQQQDWSAAEPFWRNELSGFTRPNALALAKPPTELCSDAEAVGEHLIYLPHDLTARLRDLATSAGATFNNVLQAAWATLLSRYNNEQDVVIGATRACRRSNAPDADTTVGLFVNTLPLRVRFRDDMTVADCLRDLRGRWLAMRDFENTPLLHVQRWSDVARTGRLFHTILNFQDPSWDNEFASRGGRWRNRSFSIRGQTGYPVTLDVYGGERLGIKMMFDVRCFDEAAVKRMMGHLCALLDNMSRTPTAKLADVSMLPEAEKREVISAWNQTTTRYPRSRRIHELFAEQAGKTPDAVALTFDTKSITYRKLDQQANRIARHMRQQGVTRGAKIVVCMERGPDVIACVLAVLKAGAAYVPLDPDDPQQRLVQVMEDTAARVVLTQEKFRECMSSASAEIICVDGEREAIQAQQSDPPAVPGTSGDLAYVIYTSGSTGRPKGVCVSHRAVVRLVKNTNYAAFGPEQTLLQFAPVSFDASTFEIWGALLNGGSLAIMMPGIPALDELARFIQLERVTLMFVTTGLFVQLIAHHAECFNDVRELLTGGEVMPLTAVEKALRVLPKTRLIHCYGPTENTTFTTTHDLSASGMDHASVPIGRPIANTTVFVLNAQLQPQPVGVPGELCTGGEGLAQGYLNDPALTAAKFVQHPFDKHPGARLYRTGDLVRWLPDGNVEFIGRRDNQVKVRGFRVEPGEIEAAITQHPAVACAVVCARADSDGTMSLHAWYQTREGCAIEAPALLAFLSARLPAFMMPSTLQRMEHWPLTPNGKINKAALHVSVPKLHDEPDDACNTTQEVVRGLFCQTLKIDHAGVRDDFFKLGGHSLKAMQLVASIGSAFKVSLPVRTLFHSPTVESIAAWIDAERLKAQTAAGGKPLPDSLVAICPGGSRPPLFLLPGGWGGDNEMLVFARLAAYLGNDQPLYGFNARAVQQRGFASVEEIARGYLDDIRGVHPEGEFFLAGECVAGSIAFAMACELSARNQALPVLIMLDAHCPREDRLASFSADQWYELPDEVRHYYETLLRWVPGTYSGRVHIIASDTSHRDESSLGWKESVHGTLSLTTVPGDHCSYIREYVAHTGRVLRESIDTVFADAE